MLYMLQKCTIFKIAKVFFDDPEREFSLAEIKRSANIAPTSIIIHLKELIKNGIVCKKDKVSGKRTYPFYKANFENENYKWYKFIYNLEILKKSRILEYIQDNCMPNCIIFFGSYVKAEDTKESDVDIYVQSKEKLLNLKKYERFINRKIQLHFKEDFNKYPKELKNNIINGIKLSGYLGFFNEKGNN